MKKSKPFKVSILITFFLLCFLIPGAYASPSKPFNDTADDHWCYKDIIKLNTRNVVAGYSSGDFQPNKSVTQLEAVLMAVKNLGKDSEIASMNTAKSLPITVPQWAQASLKKELLFAVQEGLIIPSENNFNASANASRAWVAQLMVRMIQKNAETSTTSDQTTGFTDRTSIPAWAKSYVNVAIQYQLASGYPDKTFRPNQTVTRAEMVSLLSRSEKYLSLTNSIVKAQVTNINGQNVTMSVNGTVKNVNLNNSTWIFDAKGKQISSSSIPTNSTVSVILSGAYVKYLEVESTEVVSKIKGTVVQVLSEQKLIAIKDATEKIVTKTIADNVTVSSSTGSTITLSQIAVGNPVEISVNSAGKVIAIALVSQSGNNVNTGIIYNIDTDKKVLIIVDSAGAYTTYQFNDQTTVTINGQRFPTIDDFRVGDEVNIKANGTVLTSMEMVKAAQQLTVTGQMVLLSTDKKLIVIQSVDGTLALSTYKLSTSVKVTISGKKTPKLADIAVDDMVNLTVSKGVVTGIQVQNRNYEETVKGTIVAVDTSSQVITLKAEGSNELKAYEVSDDAEFEIDGDTSTDLSDVKKDMKVEIQLTNSKVSYISTSSSIKGNIVSIDKSKDTITVNSEEEGEETYDIAGSANVYIFDNSNADLSDLSRGDLVTIKIENDEVIRINLVKTFNFRITKVDDSRDRLRVEDEDGDSSYLTINDNVELVVPDVDYPDIEDFDSGSVVEATFEGNTLNRVEQMAETFGKVTAINTTSKTITLQTFDGITKSFTYNSSSSVIDGDNDKYAISTLIAGDRVSIMENGKSGIDVKLMKKITETTFQSITGNLTTIYFSSFGGVWSGYDLDNDLYIHKGSTTLSTSDLHSGAKVDAYVMNDIVYEIEIN